jgi:uncharacterized membrane protein
MLSTSETSENLMLCRPSDRRFDLKLYALTPILYLMISFPTVLFLSTLIPPFQAPDETNHFRRAVQLLRGEVVGHIFSPGWAGGALPKNVGRVAETFAYMIVHPDKKVRPDLTAATRKIDWRWRDREDESFANTVIYPPTGYIPTIIGLWIGRSIGWSVLDSYYAARYCSALASVLLASFAIYTARWGRSLFFVLLSMPMTLYLFASLTQDSLLIAMTATAFSWYSRAAGEGRDIREHECYLAAVLLGCVWAARPPYLFLCPILLTLRSLRGETLSLSGRMLKRILPLAITLAIGGGWILFGASPAKTPMRLEAHVLATRQFQYFLHYPLAIFVAIYNTFHGNFGHYLKEFLGVLGWAGWSEAYLPDFCYWLVYAALLCAALMSLLQGWRLDPAQPSRLGFGILCAAAAAVTCFAVCVTLYLVWTTVAADFVDGIQGRYFLSPAFALTLAVPAFGSSLAKLRRYSFGAVPTQLKGFAWLALTAIVICLDLALPHAVLIRYYG